MAEQTVSCVLVVCFDLKRFQQPADVADDRVCRLIFEQTLVNLYDVVWTLLLNPGNNLAVPLVGKYCMHLVAVAQRIFHPGDRMHRTERLHQL